MGYFDLNGVPYRNYRWVQGEHGVGGWTYEADDKGWYYSFFCKPAGPGARKGTADTYVYVPRLTSKRRKKSDARNRSINLANGKPITKGVKVRPPKFNPPGTGYCMAEKKPVTVYPWRVIIATNGREMLQGVCPDCGCKIQKYGKLVDCPECGRHAEGSTGDYLCKACRMEADA